MWKLIVSSVVLTAGAAFLVGCGDENTTEITQVVGMQVLEAGEALPKCTADNEGAMVYSVDSAEAYYCVNRKWTTMKGEKGEDGKKGADGKSGSAGADGKDGASCTAKALKDGKGYKIVCGGDSVGVVLNGEKGDPGAKGDSGATGNNGLSAYEIAKAGGYTGSEEKWIESLKGDPGAAGTSCTAEEVTGGVKITCTDGKTFALRNGADGKDGRNFEEGWMVDPRDYHIYKIVTIGTQTWMAENLNYETAKGSHCYKDSAKNCEKHGRLYTWTTTIDVCPEGWHLPDTTEWSSLFNAVGGKARAGTWLKSTEGWYKNGNGSDAYFFSALPFTDEGDFAYFWSSTENDSLRAYYMYLYFNDVSASLDFNYKYYGFSVRCLRD